MKKQEYGRNINNTVSKKKDKQNRWFAFLNKQSFAISKLTLSYIIGLLMLGLISNQAIGQCSITSSSGTITEEQTKSVSATPVAGYVWTATSATTGNPIGSFANPTSASTTWTLSAAEQGSFTSGSNTNINIRYGDPSSSAGCTAFFGLAPCDGHELVINNTSTASILETDTKVLMGVNGGATNAYWHTVAPSWGGTIGNVNSTTTTFTPDPITNGGNRTVQIGYELAQAGCAVVCKMKSFDVIRVITGPCTTPSALSCPSNTTITTGQNVNSTASGGSGGNVTWSISPSTGVSSTNGSGLSTGNITFSNAGTYTVTFTSTNNSSPTGCNAPASVTCTRTITVNSPGPSPCNTPSSLSCNGSTTINTGQSVSSSASGGSGGNITWSISPTSGVSNTGGSGNNTGNITFNNAGTYTVTFTSTNNSNPSGCSPSASVNCSRTIVVNNSLSCTPGTSCTTSGGVAGTFDNGCNCIPNCTPGASCTIPGGTVGTYNNNCVCVCPVIIVDNTTSPATITENETKTLTGTPAGGIWSVHVGSGTILGNVYTPANISSNTNITIRYTRLQSGCPTYFEDAIFTVTPVTTTPLCTVNNTTPTASITENQTKNLVGTPSGGTWSIVSGGGTINGTTYTPPNVSSNTTVTVRYTVSGSNCLTNSADASFTVTPVVLPPTNCTHTDVTSVTLTSTGGSNGADETTKYVLANLAGNIIQITNSPTFTGLTPNDYAAYAITYKTAAGVTGLTVGQDIQNVSSTDCFNISSAYTFRTCNSEICNNGIDDDGDGLTDCNDADCTTPTITNTTPNDAICGASNGSITFTFPDNPNQTTIEFSRNAGQTWLYSTSDDAGTYTINGLPSGTYNIEARFGSTGCEEPVTTIVINDINTPAFCNPTLVFQKSIDTDTIARQGNATYTFTFYNGTGVILNNVSFSDALSFNGQFFSEPMNMTGGIQVVGNTLNTNTANLTLNNIPAGLSSFELVVDVPIGLPQWSSYCNQATIGNLTAQNPNLPNTILSDNPNTTIPNDPTCVTVKVYENCCNGTDDDGDGLLDCDDPDCADSN